MNKDFYKKLVDRFGNHHQILKTIEELHELTSVLLHVLTSNEYNNKNYQRGNIVEEMCDILMTFESIKKIYGISDNEISNYINYKEKVKEIEIFGEVIEDE